MQFLNPWLLLGALGIGVPIVIHLLNRYRFRQIDWGAMELLRRALIVRSQRIRLEDLILLALRCLALLLIALALARPTLTPHGAAWAGGQADVGVVIAVDASYSMDHRPHVQSRRDRAAARIREIFQALRPGSPATLVLLGDRPRVRLSNIRYAPVEFEEALESAVPLPERLNLELGLDEVRTLLDDIKSPVRECYLVSDAQANTWGRLSDSARQSLRQIEANGRVYFLPVGGEQAENLTLTRFELKSGFLRKGDRARYEAEVHNPGTRLRENITISLLVDDEPVEQRVIERMEPGRAATVPLLARFRKEGITRLTARLSTDELTTDNVRHAVADVRGRTRVLYVAAQGERDFVRHVLEADPTRTLAVDPISWIDLPAKRLFDYPVVILSDVPDLPPEFVPKLHEYVRQGGGLIFVLGDSVRPDVFSTRFRPAGMSLLPGEVLALAEAGESSPGWPLSQPDHPMARGLREQDVNDSRVRRYFPLRLEEGGRAVLKLAGSEQPVAAERVVGRGRVVVIATMADPQWNNLIVETGVYPVLLHQVINHLVRPAFERPLTVSAPLLLPLPSSDAGETSVQFREPSGRSLTLPLVFRDEQRLAELDPAEQPGFYEVRYSPDAPPLVAAVNVDPTEGDVRTLRAEDLDATFEGLKVRVLDESEDVAAVVRESRSGRELWKELLLAGIVVLLVETFLAHWFTRRAAVARTTLPSV